MGGRQYYRGTRSQDREAQSGQQQTLAGSRCIGDRGPTSIVPSVTAPASVLNAWHRHRCCGCGGFSTKPAGRLGGPPTAAAAAAAAGEILCRGSSFLPSVLWNAEVFGGLMGRNRLPLTGFQLQQGIEPRQRTIKVMEISVALCLGDTGLQAEGRSPTNSRASWKPRCLRARCCQRTRLTPRPTTPLPKPKPTAELRTYTISSSSNSRLPYFRWSCTGTRRCPQLCREAAAPSNDDCFVVPGRGDEAEAAAAAFREKQLAVRLRPDALAEPVSSRDDCRRELSFNHHTAALKSDDALQRQGGQLLCL